MLDYDDTTPTTDTVTYLYTVSKGTSAPGTAADPDLLATETTDMKKSSDISKWEIDTTSNNKKLGDETAKTWSVVLNKDGTVKGYLAGY